MSRPESKELRDLVQKIETLARQHPAFTMVSPAVQHFCDYLSARARIIELEDKVNGTSVQSPE